RFLGLGAPPCGECAAAFGLMAGVAVGDGDEPHAMTERGQPRAHAARALIAVVGVRPERDDVQLAVGARFPRALSRGVRMKGEPDQDRAGGQFLHETLLFLVLAGASPPLALPD